MFAVLTCIFVQHDLRLVALAALVCVTASGAAFGFHGRGAKAAGLLRSAWLGLTGLVAGSGVWATHFLAMLAYQPSLRIGYDLAETAASLAAAVLGMGIGFALPALRRDRNLDLIGGALTGSSVAVMHYMGIDAIRTQAHMTWDPRFVVASVLIGAAGGMAAFSVRERVKGLWAWAPPTGLLVLGIVGLHFTAMTAISLVPDPTLAMPDHVMGRGGLALATSGLAGFILLAGASLMLMESLGRYSTFTSLRHALNAVPAGLAFFDPADRVRVWNGAYADLMGGCGLVVEAGQARRTHIESAGAAGWFAELPDGAERWIDDLGARASQPRSEFHLPDGRWIRHESFATADGGGVAVLTDVTEHKESAAAMAAARDTAEAANRAKSEFLANMSHEIRTPLNGVLGVADVLTAGRLSKRQRELVGVIKQSGGLLNGLLGDLLDLARVEAGAVELRPELVQLDQLIGSVIALFASGAAEKGLDLQAAIDATLGAVDCDPQRLRQVLGNLVSNAVKFTDAGEVTLRATRTDGRVRFEVADTGCGFDAKQKATLFQRFRQADSSATRKHGGAGLGLAICDQFVRMMGGELVCHSTLGEGAAFSFTLDLPVRAASVSPPPPTAPLEPEAFKVGKVLIVDDHAVNRQVLELILGSAGIDHASVQDGREAVEAFATGGYDAVLMDLQMPVMDGLEATRRIRAWERTQGRRRAPILIVSANCLKEHVDAGRAAGADAHLNKPISAAELINTLGQQLRLAQAA